jgi:4-hydroxybenzoate polyprenyltransferase
MTAERQGLPGFLHYGARLLRLRDLWDKLLHIGACSVLLWAVPVTARSGVSALAIYLAAVLFLLIGGYALNDVADFRQDRLAGADPRGPGPRRSHSLAASIATLSLGMILIMAAADRVLPRAVAAGSILLGVEYSLPPLRFKERGIWGVVVGALTQRPALFLVWAATLDAWDRLVIVLTFWLFFVGMIGMLGHQVLDRGHDKDGRVRTFVFRQGPRPALRLGAACAVAAGIATVAPLILMPFARAWPVAAALAAMSGISIWKGLKASQKIGPLDPM